MSITTCKEGIYHDLLESSTSTRGSGYFGRYVHSGQCELDLPASSNNLTDLDAFPCDCLENSFFESVNNASKSTDGDRAKFGAEIQMK